MRRSGHDGGARKRVGEHHDGSFGVYMSHKIQKLRGQNEAFSSAAQTPAESALFQGIHVYVDGYTVPSKEEIRQLMLLHGGGFEHYDTGRVTHVIATHLPASKLLQLKKAKKPLPVVHPDWIVQSIEQNKVLPVQPFLYAGFADPTQNSLLSLSGSPAVSGKERTPGSSASTRGSAGLQSKSTQSVAEPGKTVALAGEELVDSDESDGDWDILAEEEEKEFEDKVAREAPQPGTTEDKRPTATKARTNSTRDGPEFVRHFFAKSRLHHIGTWRTTFQQKAADFQAKYKGGTVERASPTSCERVILHVDMDCFFVAVAVRDRPELQNVPVAVAHSSKAGSSEISSCNYLARAKGVGAGMFMQTAKELCPELVVLPYQFDAIQRVSFQIYDIFFSHTPFVQAVSCDEAFLEFGKGTNGLEKGKAIRHEIFEQTRCPASVGVSYNLLLAKLSSKKAKPDGIYHIADRSQAESFMLSLTIRDLPGAGYKTSAKLDELGVEDVRQLVSMGRNELVGSLGKASGEMLFNYARGVDVRPLSAESNMMRKSVSAVVNFGIRFEKWDDATVFLMALGEELSHRLRTLKVRAKCLTLLIKKRRPGQPVEPSKFMGHGICDNFSKSHVLSQATDDEKVIGKACIELLRQLNIPSEELRGVGVQATKLVSDTNGNHRSGQLFKAWLTDAREQGEAETKREEEPKRQTTATTFSQINMGVLEELPESLQQEILASYGRGQPPAPRPPQRKTNGKAPLRRKHPARNIFESGRNTSAAQHLLGDSRTEGTLNDIRMSQVDSEVYHSLPYAIRREIDRYAKKRKPSSTVAPLPRPASQTTPTKKTPAVVLLSIEEVYNNLVEKLEAIVEYDPAAFDEIYSRILIEVENRALDRALRMLRFVRRKCSSDAIPNGLAEVLRSGFNRVLALVNQDILRLFNGTLSSTLVSPI